MEALVRLGTASDIRAVEKPRATFAVTVATGFHNWGEGWDLTPATVEISPAIPFFSECLLNN